MREIFCKNLINLAKSLDKPLYAVGGVVRNYLIDKSIAQDFDLSAGIEPQILIDAVVKNEFKVIAEYKRTGTVVFTDGEIKYEYTAFRREKYDRGGNHLPSETEFTEDIKEDALRRDFKCNAVYYDLKNDAIVDVLGGVKDIENKVLDTVREPKKVFQSDGLRLMRLARFAGQLGFKPTDAVLKAMEENADNIKDISSERIFAELNLILQSDGKYAFSDKRGHYTGLKILEQTKVLDRIFPELTLGRGMSQRADFHKYDVLEHGLRSALYASPKIRLAALLHDIGKPFCFINNGNYYNHAVEGERIAQTVLRRLKADNDTIKQVKYLVREHMVDLDCSMKENKVRKFIVKNLNELEQLKMVKQADYRASLESDDTAPTLVKWDGIYKKMKIDGTPFSLKELKISAKELIDIGFEQKNIGKELNNLFEFAVQNPFKNTNEILTNRAVEDYEKAF